MHSPSAVAFEIKNPFSRSKYPDSLITIWHNDPESDGTDDSCGWFIRSRHVKKGIIDKVSKEFEFNWDKTYTGENGFVYNCGWFSPEGDNVLSVQGITLNMYLRAAQIVFNPDGKKDAGKTWDKVYKFLNKNHVQIAYFAENITDSLRDVIVRKFERGCNEEYTKQRREHMIKNLASIVVCDILRRERPWYKHPRWHINHWSIQIHPLQQLKRRYWDKCCVCGKRGFKGAAMSDWYGTKRWHQECDSNNKPSEPIK
jgi:hypothetical protein